MRVLVAPADDAAVAHRPRDEGGATRNPGPGRHVGRIRVPGRRPGLLLPEKVVGYAMADNMKTDLICKTIDMAVRRRPHQEEVTIFHTRPGQPVHLTAIRQTSEELQDPPLRRENRRVLGQRLGGILQTPP